MGNKGCYGIIKGYKISHTVANGGQMHLCHASCKAREHLIMDKKHPTVLVEGGQFSSI